jgi:hypothetical protein
MPKMSGQPDRNHAAMWDKLVKEHGDSKPGSDSVYVEPSSTKNVIDAQLSALDSINTCRAPDDVSISYILDGLQTRQVQDEDKPIAVVVELDRAHDGPGWYWYEDECKEEGVVGAFRSRKSAARHARKSGYAVDGK